MYSGPRGFDGAMATGEEIINNELNLDMLNLFKEQDNKLKELNSEKQNNEEEKDSNTNTNNKSRLSKRYNNFFNQEIGDKMKPQKLDRKTRTRMQMIRDKLKTKKIYDLNDEFEDKTEQNEKETQEYVDLDISTEEFFKINFFSRNIVINALFNISIFHPRWKKLTNRDSFNYFIHFYIFNRS